MAERIPAESSCAFEAPRKDFRKPPEINRNETLRIGFKPGIHPKTLCGSVRAPAHPPTTALGGKTLQPHSSLPKICPYATALSFQHFENYAGLQHGFVPVFLNKIGMHYVRRLQIYFSWAPCCEHISWEHLELFGSSCPPILRLYISRFIIFSCNAPISVGSSVGGIPFVTASLVANRNTV